MGRALGILAINLRVLYFWNFIFEIFWIFFLFYFFIFEIIRILLNFKWLYNIHS